MPKYRQELPQLSDRLFLTDGGLETTLIFHENLELPHFAAFDVLKSERGREALRSYYRTYAALARQKRTGFVLESATWRASISWGRKLGYSADSLATANRQAIDLLCEIRDEFEDERTRMVISGCIGPRGDGYRADDMMSEGEAEAYHAAQIETLRETEADMVSAFTITHAEEAIGATRAARRAGLPVVISFTVETDGRLPSGETLKGAIESVDGATDQAPAYYMINCAHPTHFAGSLPGDESWLLRIRGLRANASAKSHAELDEAKELDVGSPAELGSQYSSLRNKLRNLNVLGGCCGTDHRHLEAISRSFSTA